jgi:hypothetical protein
LRKPRPRWFCPLVCPSFFDNFPRSGLSWNDRPADAEPRRQLSPTVACRDKWRRIERLKHNKLFHALYRAAFLGFRAGIAAVFPLGTWCMRFRAPIQISTA